MLDNPEGCPAVKAALALKRWFDTSGDVPDEARFEPWEDGSAEFLQKPFRPEELDEAVARLLDQG